MKKVLFICEANIGRSQIAEGYYNFFTKGSNAMSAAVRNFRKKYHYRPTREFIELMKEDGVDISEQQIKLLTKKMLDNAEKIIVLCDKALCPEFLLKKRDIIFATITDPFGRSERTTKNVRDQIKEIVLNIIDKKL